MQLYNRFSHSWRACQQGSRSHTIHYTLHSQLSPDGQLDGGSFLSAPAVIPTASWYYSDASHSANCLINLGYCEPAVFSTWVRVPLRSLPKRYGCRHRIKAKNAGVSQQHVTTFRRWAPMGKPPEQSQPARNTVDDTSATPVWRASEQCIVTSAQGKTPVAWERHTKKTHVAGERHTRKSVAQEKHTGSTVRPVPLDGTSHF